MTNSSNSQPTPKLKFIPTAATFQLKELIGSGTVGAVYRAESPDLDCAVAIKLLHPTVSHDPNIVDRFQREIAIMERLNHPHIVHHYGGGLMDGQFFYAMQLLNHGSLKERLKQHGPIPWQQVAIYGAQIASALQHAHNYGIIHRDLKPSNLFFDADSKLILGDFGIAHDTHDADITADGITVGTYAYMAPEQICADESITGKADLYSLGCAMVEMLTGKPPFVGANFAQIWDQHLHQSPQGLRSSGVDCPEWLESLIMQLLTKDPEQRPFNARAVQGVLMEHLHNQFGSYLEQFAIELPPLEQPHTRSPWIGIIIGFGLIGAAIASGIFMGQ
ncbi:MAG: serine/threonine-protein kinase [Pirellulales bacterium]